MVRSRHHKAFGVFASWIGKHMRIELQGVYHYSTVEKYTLLVIYRN